MQHINDALSSVLGNCGRRNLRIVLDAVTTAIDTVGRGYVQQQQAAIQQLMVPLFQRWQQAGLTEQVMQQARLIIWAAGSGNIISQLKFIQLWL